MTTFTVAYRCGGPAACEWKRTLAFVTRPEADAAAASIEAGGRKALVYRTAELDRIGLPEGW